MLNLLKRIFVPAVCFVSDFPYRAATSTGIWHPLIQLTDVDFSTIKLERFAAEVRVWRFRTIFLVTLHREDAIVIDAYISLRVLTFPATHSFVLRNFLQYCAMWCSRNAAFKRMQRRRFLTSLSLGPLHTRHRQFIEDGYGITLVLRYWSVAYRFADWDRHTSTLGQSRST